ncbi:MAG: hypothetical protein LAO21_00780 [Acidobacteriia bacterium]|nr:hypothetical protein [Terriglobia bacterium]
MPAAPGSSFSISSAVRPYRQRRHRKERDARGTRQFILEQLGGATLSTAQASQKARCPRHPVRHPTIEIPHIFSAW